MPDLDRPIDARDTQGGDVTGVSKLHLASYGKPYVKAAAATETTTEGDKNNFVPEAAREALQKYGALEDQGLKAGTNASKLYDLELDDNDVAQRVKALSEATPQARDQMLARIKEEERRLISASLAEYEKAAKIGDEIDMDACQKGVDAIDAALKSGGLSSAQMVELNAQKVKLNHAIELSIRSRGLEYMVMADLGLKQGYNSGENNLLAKGVEGLRQLVKDHPELEHDRGFFEDLGSVSKKLIPMVFGSQTAPAESGAPAGKTAALPVAASRENGAPVRNTAAPVEPGVPKPEVPVTGIIPGTEDLVNTVSSLIAQLQEAARKFQANGNKLNAAIDRDFNNVITAAENLDQAKLKETKAPLEKLMSEHRLTPEQKKIGAILEGGQNLRVDARLPYAQALHESGRDAEAKEVLRKAFDIAGPDGYSEFFKDAECIKLAKTLGLGALLEAGAVLGPPSTAPAAPDADKARAAMRQAASDLNERLAGAYQALDDDVARQGWLGGAWNSLKNVIHKSTGSDALRKELDSVKPALQALTVAASTDKYNPDDFRKLYRQLTGADYNPNNKVDLLVAKGVIQQFEHSQGEGVEFEANTGTAIFSGLATLAMRRFGGAGLFRTSVVSGITGAGTKWGLKAADGTSDARSDIFSGGVIGFLLPGADRGAQWGAGRLSSSSRFQGFASSHPVAARFTVAGAAGGIFNGAANAGGYTVESSSQGNFDPGTAAKQAGWGFVVGAPLGVLGQGAVIGTRNILGRMKGEVSTVGDGTGTSRLEPSSGEPTAAGAGADAAAGAGADAAAGVGTDAAAGAGEPAVAGAGADAAAGAGADTVTGAGEPAARPSEVAAEAEAPPAAGLMSSPTGIAQVTIAAKPGELAEGAVHYIKGRFKPASEPDAPSIEFINRTMDHVGIKPGGIEFRDHMEVGDERTIVIPRTDGSTTIVSVLENNTGELGLEYKHHLPNGTQIVISPAGDVVTWLGEHDIQSFRPGDTARLADGTTISPRKYGQRDGFEISSGNIKIHQIAGRDVLYEAGPEEAVARPTAEAAPVAGADVATGARADTAPVAGADTVAGARADTVAGAGADTIAGAGADAVPPSPKAVPRRARAASPRRRARAAAAPAGAEVPETAAPVAGADAVAGAGAEETVAPAPFGNQLAQALRGAQLGRPAPESEAGIVSRPAQPEASAPARIPRIWEASGRSYERPAGPPSPFRGKVMGINGDQASVFSVGDVTQVDAKIGGGKILFFTRASGVEIDVPNISFRTTPRGGMLVFRSDGSSSFTTIESGRPLHIETLSDGSRVTLSTTGKGSIMRPRSDVDVPYQQDFDLAHVRNVTQSNEAELGNTRVSRGTDGKFIITNGDVRIEASADLRSILYKKGVAPETVTEEPPPAPALVPEAKLLAEAPVSSPAPEPQAPPAQSGKAEQRPGGGAEELEPPPSPAPHVVPVSRRISVTLDRAQAGGFTNTGVIQVGNYEFTFDLNATSQTTFQGVGVQLLDNNIVITSGKQVQIISPDGSVEIAAASAARSPTGKSPASGPEPAAGAERGEPASPAVPAAAIAGVPSYRTRTVQSGMGEMTALVVTVPLKGGRGPVTSEATGTEFSSKIVVNGDRVVIPRTDNTRSVVHLVPSAEGILHQEIIGGARIVVRADGTGTLKVGKAEHPFNKTEDATARTKDGEIYVNYRGDQVRINKSISSKDGRVSQVVLEIEIVPGQSVSYAKVRPVPMG